MSKNEIITKTEAAKRWNVGRSTVSLYVTKGMPVRADRKLDWPAADGWRREWIASTRSCNPKVRFREQPVAGVDPLPVNEPEAEVPPITLAEAVRRKEYALARLRELQVIEKEGGIVSLDDATALWTEQITNCRARLLAIPQALAPVVAIESSPAQCLELIRAEIHDALKELAVMKKAKAINSAELAGFSGTIDAEAAADTIHQAETFAGAQSRKESALADLRTLEYRRKSDELIEVSEVERFVSQVGQGFKDALLQLPERIAEQLAALTDPRQIRDILRGEFRTILGNLQLTFAPKN